MWYSRALINLPSSPATVPGVWRHPPGPVAGEEILPGPVVTVVTSKATFRTKKLVVTAGAWTPALMKKLGVELPLQVSLIYYVWL